MHLRARAARALPILVASLVASLTFGLSVTDASAAEDEPATATARPDGPSATPAPHETIATKLEERTWGPHAGFRVATTPGVAFDVQSSRVGFNLGLEGTLGFELGPIVLAGGIAAQILVPKDTSILMGFPELRLIVPIGDFAPFIVGGAGLGADATTGTANLAIRVGGGIQWVYTDELSVVLGGAYHTVGKVAIASVELGPRVSF